MIKPIFNITALDGRARAGEVSTMHGIFPTPAFMPVGTLGAVKTLSPQDLLQCGAEIILANAYHLSIRPGEDIVSHFGGLNRFINWDRPILTDSGGFQVFSLAERRKISEDGVVFRCHLDGALLNFTPERAIEIQEKLSSSIVMCFDECVPNPADKEYVLRSLERTARWGKRCKDAKTDNGQLLFGIVQGGVYMDLRALSAKMTVGLGFDGYAIGGLSVGEPKSVMYEAADLTAGLLPPSSPRYLMGVGTPEDILTGISYGIDMFDCVMPTRNARNGLLFTSAGKVHIKRKEYEKSDLPIDSACGCYACKNFSRGYLRHLYKSGEILALRLNSLHNITYYLSLVKGARKAIKEGVFADYKKSCLESYTLGVP
jgi:queuine tRNA-ribosyltransferase